MPNKKATLKKGHYELHQKKIETPENFFHEHGRFLIGMAVTLILTVGTYFLQTSTSDFFASVLDIEKPAPFDGTALPIAELPEWTSLSGGEYQILSAKLPIDKRMELPNYDPTVFGVEVASVGRTTQVDRDRVNQLITYSTPYMGTYSGHSKEYEGSHLGVDIKAPIGTPVHAVANGKVLKVMQNSAGFGMHVLIEHTDVPLIDSNETTTLYSAYAHLSNTLVTKNQIVKKGEKIALTGNTGTSTGPHLHFQIDKNTVPWHPWWPFSSVEARKAGVSFFDGVNVGLNKEAAAKNTINPMLWVQKHLIVGENNPDLHASAGESDVKKDEDTKKNDSETPKDDADIADQPPKDEPDQPKNNQKSDEPEQSSEPKSDPIVLSFSGDDFAMVGNSIDLKVFAKNKNGEIIADFAPSDPIEISSSNSEIKISDSSLTASDFKNGKAEIEVTSEQVGEIQLVAALADVKTEKEVNFIKGIAKISSFKVSFNGSFAFGQPQKIEIQAVDESGKPTPDSQIAGVVKLSTSTGRGDFDPIELESGDFQQGKAVVELSYESPENFKIIAQEGVLIGESKMIRPEVFTDVSFSHENSEAISYLKKKKIIGGYDDGSFKPNKTVSRVEAVKMLLGGFGIETEGSAKLNFPDTSSDQWYAPFVAKAVEKEIVKGYPDGSFQPTNTVNRAEYLKILLKTAGVTATDTESDYSDVKDADWFAPFAAYAQEANIFDNGSVFDGTRGMTRAEVAETIYRLLVIQKNNVTKYKKNLEI